MSGVFVQITATRGSVPREAGTAMEVNATGTRGTIGGGALEFEAITLARALLARDAVEEERTFPLGPSLGQCCGGAVTLRFTREVCVTDEDRAPPCASLAHRGFDGALWLWGAGHVGRAIVAALPMGAGAITWVDTGLARFPERVPDHVRLLPAKDMSRAVALAPAGARHLILTYSHEIDFALCAALLRRGESDIGLIGSETKKARFFKRLRALGLDPAPIRCPIGDKALGKEPAQIARGVVMEILREARAA